MRRTHLAIATSLGLLLVLSGGPARAGHEDGDPRCSDVEVAGSESLSVVVSDAQTGEALGGVIAAGRDVRVDAVATVEGSCEIWSRHPVTKACYRSSGPFLRTITGMTGRHEGPDGRRGQAREFAVDPDGRTTRVARMDSRDDTRTSRGPVIEHRDVVVGEYVDTIVVRIDPTPCDLLPETLTAEVRFRVAPVSED